MGYSLCATATECYSSFFASVDALGRWTPFCALDVLSLQRLACIGGGAVLTQAHDSVT